ncbi:MAG: hypothetical protein WA869_14720 [Alloacidobacterium sp.]
MFGSATFDTLERDLRFSLRTLARNPGFTSIALLTIALGIGVNSAMFSIVQGVILAPLTFPEADRLVFLWQKRPGVPQLDASYPTSKTGSAHRAHSIPCPQWFFITSISLRPGEPSTLRAFGHLPLSSRRWE